MKKFSYNFCHFFKLNYDDMASASIDSFFAGVLVKKRLFIPKRKKYKIKPVIKTGMIQGFEIKAPYWFVKQFLMMLRYEPVIDEEYIVSNCVGIEDKYVYRIQWDNPDTFNKNINKGD